MAFPSCVVGGLRAAESHHPKVPLTHMDLQGEGLVPPPPPGPPPPAPQQLAARPTVGAIQDEFPDEYAAYVVFTSKTEDKRSRRRQHQEVNAVASNNHEFMHWSEKPISWS